MTFDVSQYFRKIDVLDKGYIELDDGMFKEPKLKVVNTARVSYAKRSESLGDKDIRLIEFLLSSGHSSVLRHSYYSFRIKAPLFVFRQAWKYQVGSQWMESEEFTDTGSIEILDSSWNEQSGRFTEFQPEFYIPTELRKQSKSNKQGSDGLVTELIEIEDLSGHGITSELYTPIDYLEESIQQSFQHYQTLIGIGVAREQARLVLPVNLYSECIWTCSLQTILYFLSQRLKQDAQFEIRQYALAIRELMSPMIEILIERYG